MSFDVIVREPVPIVKEPLTTASPPKTETVLDAAPLPPREPETKKLTSLPGSAVGNKASGRFATITVPDTPMSEFVCRLPDILPTKAIDVSYMESLLNIKIINKQLKFTFAL